MALNVTEGTARLEGRNWIITKLPKNPESRIDCVVNYAFRASAPELKPGRVTRMSLIRDGMQTRK